MVVQDQGPLFKANASYNCDSGFTLQGNRTRTCLPTGHWSGSEPLCNGIVILFRIESHNDLVVLLCNGTVILFRIESHNDLVVFVTTN